MNAIDQDRLRLVHAVRLARAQGFSWEKIGALLAVSRDVARERFGDVDDGGLVVELPQPLPVVEEPAPAPAPPTEPELDFSGLRGMTEAEIVDMAKGLPTDGKLYDRYLSRLREAIVGELYRRNWAQRQIAVLIGKSPQRVSQIFAAYHDRIDRAWEAERASRGEGES